MFAMTSGASNPFDRGGAVRPNGWIILLGEQSGAREALNVAPSI